MILRLKTEWRLQAYFVVGHMNMAGLEQATLSVGLRSVTFAFTFADQNRL
jgi:hypothetical protein